jgi:hypothetical protein
MHVTIDNPPVNALSPGVPEGIDAGVARAAAIYGPTLGRVRLHASREGVPPLSRVYRIGTRSQV